MKLQPAAASSHRLKVPVPIRAHSWGLCYSLAESKYNIPSYVTLII